MDCQIISDRWEGKKNGGQPPLKKDGDAPVDQTTSMSYKFDNDDKWFLNPQYKIDVTDAQRFYFSLSQADFKTSGNA